MDPEKDIRAKKMRIRSGIQTWAQAVSEEGYDPDEQREAIRETNEAFDRDGIILDCDPRLRTDNGGSIKSSEEKTPTAPPPHEETE